MNEAVYGEVASAESLGLSEEWAVREVDRPGERVRQFEDLVAWQKARALSREIYGITGNGPFARDYGLRDQIRRAVVSVMSNIAEGFDRGGRKEFHQFLVIAKASCAEVRSQLYIALDAGYISSNEFESLYRQTEEVGRVVNGLRQAVARNS